MIAILIAIRDTVIAIALAWVGVSIESTRSAEGCAGESCRTQGER